jgi:hypothetical protein
VSVRVPPETAAAKTAGAHPIAFEVQRLNTHPDTPVAHTAEESTFVLPR